MAGNAKHAVTIALPRDGRQSDAALSIQRGVCGMLIQRDFTALTELTLATGRRADIAAIDRRGDVWIIEIKSSVPDFRTDRKWPDYRAYCDAFYFAVGPDMPLDILPQDTGLMIADEYGAEIIRDAPGHRLAAPRRKAVTLRFARAAALRLMGVDDIKVDFA